jgi:hypothetical protein
VVSLTATDGQSEDNDMPTLGTFCAELLGSLSMRSAHSSRDWTAYSQAAYS